MTVKRKIGRDLEVSAVGYGCMGITHASGNPMTLQEGIKTVQAAYDLGYTFFDTAECYQGMYPDGTIAFNEDAVGQALKPMRDHAVIATKFGVQHAGDYLIMDSRPETIRRSVEGSLQRLCTDHIDLYYQHRIDPKVAPETVAETMAGLIKEGKITHWGISEANEDYLRRANAVCPVSAIENRYSMMARWYEPLFPVLEELGISYVAYSPMANGFLTGKYNPSSAFGMTQDFRRDMPQYSEAGYEKDRPLLDLLHVLSEAKHATMAQLSMAWMLCKKPYIIPIPGTRREERMKENLGAADIILSKEEIAAIDAQLDQMQLEVFGGHR